MAKPTLTVLLAEDNDIVRKMNALFIPTAFPDYEVQVDEVQDGKELLERGKAREYDVTVSDINMPYKSGPAAAIELRSVGKLKGGKALFLTGLPTDENTRPATEAGFPYLAKPYGPAELTKTLRKIWPEYAPSIYTDGTTPLKGLETLPEGYEYHI